MNGLTKQYR